MRAVYAQPFGIRSRQRLYRDVILRNLLFDRVFDISLVLRRRWLFEDFVRSGGQFQVCQHAFELK